MRKDFAITFATLMILCSGDKVLSSECVNIKEDVLPNDIPKLRKDIPRDITISFITNNTSYIEDVKKLLNIRCINNSDSYIKPIYLERLHSKSTFFCHKYYNIRNRPNSGHKFKTNKD